MISRSSDTANDNWVAVTSASGANCLNLNT